MMVSDGDTALTRTIAIAQSTTVVASSDDWHVGAALSREDVCHLIAAHCSKSDECPWMPKSSFNAAER